jgi:hypothetical protein
MSLHLDTLFWFRANQSLLFFFSAACLPEKQQIPISVFGLTRPGLELTLTITPPMRFIDRSEVEWKTKYKS